MEKVRTEHSCEHLQEFYVETQLTEPSFSFLPNKFPIIYYVQSEHSVNFNNQIQLKLWCWFYTNETLHKAMKRPKKSSGEQSLKIVSTSCSWLPRWFCWDS